MAEKSKIVPLVAAIVVIGMLTVSVSGVAAVGDSVFTQQEETPTDTPTANETNASVGEEDANETNDTVGEEDESDSNISLTEDDLGLGQEDENATDGNATDGNATVGDAMLNESEMGANVTFENQTSNGTTVMVNSTTLPDGGFLVVFNQTMAGPLGNSSYLENGTHENVSITLNQTLTENTTVIVAAFNDTGERTAVNETTGVNETDETETNETTGVNETNETTSVNETDETIGVNESDEMSENRTFDLGVDEIYLNQSQPVLTAAMVNVTATDNVTDTTDENATDDETTTEDENTTSDEETTTDENTTSDEETTATEAEGET